MIDARSRLLVGLVLVLTLPTLSPAADPPPVQAADGPVLVGAGSHWRYYVMLSRPMVSKAAAQAADIADDAREIKLDAGREYPKPSPLLLNVNTPPPPTGWTGPDFDDRGWTEHRGPLRADPPGTAWPTDLSPEFGLVCLRSKFLVGDPAAVKGLQLRIAYRGGAVVYLNGQEIARASLAAGKLEATTPGDDYPPQATLKDDKTLLHWYRDAKHEGFALRDRQAGPIEVKAEHLCKGLNVLGVELHRSDYPAPCQKLGMRWGANGLTSIHLTAQAAAGVRTSLTRAPGLQVWNIETARRLLDLDFADPAEPLGPIRIVAARNGSFSGAAAVGCDLPIEGLKATVSDLKAVQGNADGTSASRAAPRKDIPAAACRIRYGLLDPRPLNLDDDLAHGLKAATFDALVDEPPAALTPPKLAGAAGRQLLGMPTNPVPGVVRPVWLTVRVDRDTAPGLYRGELTVTAAGQPPVAVPVELDVRDFTLPDIKDRVTLLNMYQSPDALAIRYKVTPWSKEHWDLIERSVRLMAELGNDFIPIPLLSKDQFGNEESMVHWRRSGPMPATALAGDVGKFQLDFAPMEKYLDLFLKYHDKARIKCVVAVCWGSAAVKDAATVTAVDDKGTKSDLTLPPYGTKEFEDLWRPVLEGFRRRLKDRGLEKTMMLGMPWDVGPKAEHVAMFRNLTPDLPWMRASHPDGAGYPYDAKEPQKIVPLAVVERVWTGPIPHPSQGRNYGWKLDRMRVSFNRDGYGPLSLLGFRPPWAYHIWLEASLATNDRGAGRVGADFYDLGIKLDLASLKGGTPAGDSFGINTGNRGTVYNRYLTSAVGQIGLANNTTDLCPAGPTGPVASIRYEQAREGIQEAEALVIVEKALLDKKLDGPAAEEAWKLVDERINALRLYHIKLGMTGWQDRARRLFDLAGRVQAARELFHIGQRRSWSASASCVNLRYGFFRTRLLH